MSTLPGPPMDSKPKPSSAIAALIARSKVVDATVANAAKAKSGKIPDEIADLPEKILKTVNHEKLLKQTPFFRCPEWAKAPPNGCHLEVTKEGVKTTPLFVDRHPFTLIGRKHSVVDLLVEHQSLSSVHCCIVHREDGVFFLVDLSKNGVWLEGKRLVPNKYTKFDFDTTFTMGQSSRKYTLRKKPPVRTSSRTLGVQGPNDRAKVDTRVSLADALSTTPVPEGDEAPPVAEDAPEEEIVDDIERPLRHILIKHVDVENAVSKNPRNKGEAVTRCLDDAIDQAKMIRETLMESCDGDANIAEEFSNVATELSECATAKKGGNLGKIKRGMFAPEFDKAAFALPPGAISEPVVSSIGVHLILRVPE